ncbi:unnamed protein product [Gongylonema pulchrum]|uniref:Uncharacterized protein n=1 Tax=Gongylonema pulchrum TaxID=637853 RepID=A0A183F0A8_9BILA|nr:unnamed protein product [Gongylonema pulchrum]
MPSVPLYPLRDEDESNSVHCKSDCLSPELEESSDSGHTSGSGNAGTPAASASRTFQSSHRSSLLNPMYQQRFPRFQPSSAVRFRYFRSSILQELAFLANSIEKSFLSFIIQPIDFNKHWLTDFNTPNLRKCSLQIKR